MFEKTPVSVPSTLEELGAHGVSIVLGSLNRLPFLQKMIQSVRDELQKLGRPSEMIVIDGGSEDGSAEWLLSQKDIITIIQHNHGKWQSTPLLKRSWGGFMNLGFKAAHGKYLCMLSDDALLVPESLVNGYAEFENQLAAGKKLGAMAFYHRNYPLEKTYYVNRTLGNTVMVNHGLFLNRALLDVGYIDEGFLFYHGDDDLALKLADAGYQTTIAENSFVEHSVDLDPAQRAKNSEKQIFDYIRLLEKWKTRHTLPENLAIHSKITKEFEDPRKTAQPIPRLALRLNWRAAKIKTRAGDIVRKAEKEGLLGSLMLRKMKAASDQVVKKEAEGASSDLALHVLILALEKDSATLPHVIASVRRHVKHPLKAITVVGPQSQALSQMSETSDAHFIEETRALPFKKNGCNDGLYQQFIRLNADLLTKEETLLVIDADTVFVRPRVFELAGRFLLECSEEALSQTSRDVQQRLFGAQRRFPLSFFAHNMIMTSSDLRSFRAALEARHGKPWHQAILENIDTSEASIFSGYESYAGFMWSTKKNKTLPHLRRHMSAPREALPYIDLFSSGAPWIRTVSFHSNKGF